MWYEVGGVVFVGFVEIVIVLECFVSGVDEFFVGYGCFFLVCIGVNDVV